MSEFDSSGQPQEYSRQETPQQQAPKATNANSGNASISEPVRMMSRDAALSGLAGAGILGTEYIKGVLRDSKEARITRIQQQYPNREATVPNYKEYISAVEKGTKPYDNIIGFINYTEAVSGSALGVTLGAVYLANRLSRKSKKP
jgi:hypothetical protein